MHLTACNPIVLSKRTHTIQVARDQGSSSRQTNYRYVAECVYQSKETGGEPFFLEPKSESTYIQA
jgi:hypothetical protein